jgi:hypothetical protein
VTTSATRLGPSGQEGADGRIPRVGHEAARVAERRHGARIGVEERGRVCDGEDARQLVRHDDERAAQALAQLEDEVVQPG